MKDASFHCEKHVQCILGSIVVSFKTKIETNLKKEKIQENTNLKFKKIKQNNINYNNPKLDKNKFNEENKEKSNNNHFSSKRKIKYQRGNELNPTENHKQNLNT